MPTGHWRRKRRTVDGQTIGWYGLTEEDLTERLERKALLAKAKAGDAEAIKALADKYRLKTLMLGRRFVILNGVGVRC